MALGNVVWFSIVRVLPANVAALSSVMVPVVAMVCGAIVYQDPLVVTQLVAMVCCASGLLLALTQPGQRAKKRIERPIPIRTTAAPGQPPLPALRAA